MRRILSIGAVSALMFTASLSAHAADEIGLEWKDGNTAIASFTEYDVVVPGDTDRRVIKVTNNGPSDAVLTGWIYNVTLADEPLADGFYDDIDARWDGALGSGGVAFRDVGAQHEMGSVPIAMGETVEVGVGYLFPVEATTGNYSNVGERIIHYDVLFELKGETPAGEISTSLKPVLDDANNNGNADVGEWVTWELTITNTGGGPIFDVTNNQGFDCPKTTLQAGESMVCTKRVQVTQADVNRGELKMNVVVQGKTSDGSRTLAETVKGSLSIDKPIPKDNVRGHVDTGYGITGSPLFVPAVTTLIGSVLLLLLLGARRRRRQE